MKFSVCIPNYNYGRYIGRTIQSVLAQDFEDFEIIVSDNCSTDNSWDVVTQIQDSRLKCYRNRCNLGFAANLDRAARHASADFLIMLSSDDIMGPGALRTYSRVIDKLGESAVRCVWSSAVEVIDSNDSPFDRYGILPSIWTGDDVDARFTDWDAGTVYSLPGPELLRRSISLMKNPLTFAATCYPRELYNQIEGYGGGRLINPDRWFNWRLFGVAQRVLFLDTPLFGYRVHSSNQGSQQLQTQALKFHVDEYITTLELEPALLDAIGMTRTQLVDFFIEHDIARHALATLGKGSRQRALQILNFGRAVYPQAVKHNRKIWALRMLLAMGPLGTAVARYLYHQHSTTASNGTSNN